MRSILISGGAGFIGSNLVLKLLSKGYSIIILDSLNPQIHSADPEQSYTYQLIKDKVRFIKGNVENKEDWLKALIDADVVVHLAAETGTGQSMYEINRYTETNIKGTSILLDILTNHKNNVKKLIVSSSRSIYGEGKYRCLKHGIIYPDARQEDDLSKGDYEIKCPFCRQNAEMLPTDEDSLLHPSSIYGFTKQAQEQMSMIVGKAVNLPVVSFRFQNVYGPGQSLKNPYTGILSIFSTRIKNNHDINIFEDGLETRDFVYIDDVTDALILGIESPEADYNTFNVGSGENLDVLKIANILKDKYKSNVNVTVSGNYRLGDIRHNLADLSKINKLLGYVPKYNFENGISRFIDWVEKQEVEKDNYELSIDEMKIKGLYKEQKIKI